jgi:hypothetical protein
VDARFDFDQVKGFADEILGAGLQGAQLVAGLRGQDNDGKVFVLLAGF